MPNQPPPRRDTPPRFSPDERELLLQNIRRLEKRQEELERAVASGGALVEDVRGLIEDQRKLSEDVRELLNGDREQERHFWQLHSQVQILAAQSGGLAGTISGKDAGDIAGRQAAQDATKHAGAKWTSIMMLVSAITSGIVYGVARALEPVRVPAPTQQLPP